MLHKLVSQRILHSVSRAALSALGWRKCNNIKHDINSEKTSGFQMGFEANTRVDAISSFKIISYDEKKKE